MTHRFIFVAIIKALLLAVPLILLSFSLKELAPGTPWPGREQAAREQKIPTVYFLGGSRMQASISPDLLKTKLPDFDYVNLSISRNTFLFSCQVAMRLLQQDQEKKIVFIELSDLSVLPSNLQYLLLSPSEIRSAIGQQLSVRHSLKDIGRLLFYIFNIQSDVMRLVYPHTAFRRTDIGYISTSRKLTNGTPAIRSPKSLPGYSTVSPDVLELYLSTIGNLRTLAERSGSEVIVLLPLTGPQPNVMDIEGAVHTHFQESEKWQYSPGFLSRMNHAEYFSDATHLNSEGSRHYCLELAQFISERFNEKAPSQ